MPIPPPPHSADLKAVGVSDEDANWFLAFLVTVQLQMLTRCVRTRRLTRPRLLTLRRPTQPTHASPQPLRSMAYHVFLCLPEHVALAVLRADLVGVAVITLSQLALSLHLTFTCVEHLRVAYVWTLGAVLGVAAVMALWPNLPRIRPYLTSMYVVGAAFGAAFCLHGILLAHEDVLQAAIATPAAVYLCFAAGFGFYISNFPERLRPGGFDVLGASHQWWHLCIVAGTASTAYGCWHIAHLRAQLSATDALCSHLEPGPSTV